MRHPSLQLRHIDRQPLIEIAPKLEIIRTEAPLHGYEPSGDAWMPLPDFLLDGCRYLVVPGHHEEASSAYRSQWERTWPALFGRIEMPDARHAQLERWTTRIDAAIRQTHSPVVLLAHGMGCAAVAHWCGSGTADGIAGALLVAPMGAEHATGEGRDENPWTPTKPLPFPSVVLASTNDPFIGMEPQAKYAAYWGSRFVCVGDKGHVHADTHPDVWEEGMGILKKRMGER